MENIKMTNNIVIEDAKIIFRNFEGVETKYNRKGDRNFGLLIEDPILAERLIEDGWNVKPLERRDEDDDIKHFLSVAVSFNGYPPKVVVITGRNHRQLDEFNIGDLDQMDIRSVDIIVRPYNWEVNGKTGVKGYLKSLYVIIEEDELSEKYSDLLL